MSRLPGLIAVAALTMGGCEDAAETLGSDAALDVLPDVGADLRGDATDGGECESVKDPRVTGAVQPSYECYCRPKWDRLCTDGTIETTASLATYAQLGCGLLLLQYVDRNMAHPGTQFVFDVQTGKPIGGLYEGDASFGFGDISAVQKVKTCPGVITCDAYNWTGDARQDIIAHCLP